MLSFFISITIILIVGTLGGFLYAKYIYPNVFGGVRVSILVGVFGGIIGGFALDLFFKTPLLNWIGKIPYLSYLFVNPADVNFLSLVLGVWLFLAIYQYASEHTERS